MITLPALSPTDRETLKKSIAEYGVLEAAVLAYDDPEGIAPDGERVDGDHRQQICAELGIDCPTRSVRGWTGAQREIYALHVNAARRQMSVEERRHVWREYRGLIADRLKANPQRSDADIAKEVSTDPKTVAKERRALEGDRDIPITAYKPGSGSGEGGGMRELVDESAPNYADHRNEVWVEMTINYPCPSDDIRKRGDDVFPAASERLNWPSGRIWLSAAAPENDAQFAILLTEIVKRMQRVAVEKPFKTMRRRETLYA